ncbi:hypothetical protein KBD45_00025 [Candidatus Dojkabacteria bacterium]|nr:hypothetical protein [Candidatus Dojkabacteria bacterium]
MPEFKDLTKLLLENGIYIETLLVIYTLPLLITIINFFKYIIGTKTIGTFTPILIVYIFWTIAGIKGTFSTTDFFQILGKEVLLSFILLTTLFGSIALVYSMLYKIKLHYLPKISTILIFAIVSMILLFWALIKLNFNFLDKITPLSIILLVIVSEQFLGVYIKNDLAKAIYLFLETFIVSVITYFIIIQPQILNTLIINPWIILISLPLNILIGKFTGLRLTEYFRFYELLTQNKDADSSDPEK